jgi:hypothetical protein
LYYDNVLFSICKYEYGSCKGKNNEFYEEFMLDQKEKDPLLIPTLLRRAYELKKYEVLDVLEQEDFVIPEEYLLARAIEWFRANRFDIKSLKDYIHEHPFLDTDENRKKIFDISFVDKKISTDALKYLLYIPYASVSCLESIIDEWMSSSVDNSNNIIDKSILSAIFTRSDFTANYANTIAKKLYMADDYDKLLLLIGSVGLKIDKNMIADRTMDFIKKEKN